MNNLVALGNYHTKLTRFLLTKERTLQYVDSVESGPNPTWLEANPSQQFLYVTNENLDESSGWVESYRITESGDFSFINRIECKGAAPCHIYVDDESSLLYVSNYLSGSLSIMKMSNGTIQDDVQVITHRPVPEKTHLVNRGGSHVHHVEMSEFGGLLNVVDLGLDTITQYKLNDGSDKSFGKFVCETAVNIVHMPTGSGPRRIRFHPSGSFALVLNECNSSLNVVHVVDRDEGLLAVREAYIAGKSTLRDTDTDGDYGAIQGEDVTMMGAAELIISPCGKWAYVSNRDVSAPNRERSSIAVFSITIKDNGVDVEVYLDLLQHVSTFGEHPRHFSLLHAERQLLVANQKSNNVVSYLWDSQGTGLIDESSAVVSTHGGNILAPACLFILPR